MWIENNLIVKCTTYSIPQEGALTMRVGIKISRFVLLENYSTVLVTKSWNMENSVWDCSKESLIIRDAGAIACAENKSIYFEQISSTAGINEIGSLYVNWNLTARVEHLYMNS